MSSSLGDSTNVRTCLLDHDLLQRNLRIPVFTRGSDRRQTKANVSLKLIAETSKVIEEKSTGSSIDDPMLNDNNDSSKVIAKANKLQTCSTLATTACFRTAGAKKIITVSDESIAITSNLLECKRDMFNGNGNSIESTGQNEFHHRLELNSKAPLPLSPVEPIDAPVPTQPKQATAACFLTAGARKRIPVSDESIAKARKVLERERKMSKKNTNTNAKKPEEESVSCNPLKPKALQAPPQLLPTDFSIEPFSAHQKEVTTVCSRTDGARKTTSVLNESMANAIRLRGRGKEMSNEIAESSAFSKPRNPDLNLPLRFKVDPTSPSTGDSIQTWISTMPLESCTACFRTAGSRKTISVSDESISNATRLLERGNSRGNDGSSRSAQLNESHLSPPSNLNAAKTSRNELLPSQSIESNTICFQTAGTGKVIKVTEDSITTATNLLERGEAMAFHSQPSKDTFRSNSNVKIGPTLPPLSVIESTWPVDTSVASFQTAGAGKKIIVSDESIATATKLMERGIYMSSGNSKSTDSIKKKESSRRLGMKSDSTSISSLQIGLQLDTGSSRAEMTVETNGGWEALPPLISTISEKDSMACFRTAGTDKTVVVEEASMKKAKILLEPKENECSGQHVARKPVVSDEPHFPLYRSSKTVNPPGKEIRNVLPCFRTAGTKKTIYVSDESIDKTTKLFELGSVFYQHDKPSESTQRNNTDVSLHTISRSVSSGPISSPTKFSKETIQPRAFFRTADIEKTICVSDATQKAAANLLECVNDTCLENGESSKGAGESYLHKSLGIVDDSKQVSACSIGTSFLTAGSGQRVTFTESSLERAEKLFSRRVENTTEAFFMAKRNSDKTTSVHAPLQQQEDPTLISGSRFTAGSCSGSSVHKQKEIYKRQKVSPVTIQFERSRKYDDKSNEEKFSEDELDLAANIGNSSNRLAPHFLIAPNKSKNSDISYADQEQAQVAVAPVTPLPHVSTPHNQLIRWGSIRRVTYGMTPASSVRKSQVGKQDTDYLSSPKRQTLSSSLPNSRMANEAKMTPYGIVTENVKSKIAMSTGTSPCRKRPLSFEENTMTPVPFNCSNEETLETTLEPQLLESTVTMMGKKGQECTSLMGAFASGEFTRHPDVCLQHGVSQVVIAVNSTNASNLCFEPKTNLPLQFTNIEKELQSVILGRVQDIREALVSEGCDSKLFSDKWILNHKRWVVWKVASYERSFSKFLGGRHLTYQNLIGNMKKRYDKEIKNGLRPAIRKVLNRDAAASRLIILIVCQILPSTGHRLGVMDSSEGYPTEPNKFKIELSDGWYSIQAALDDSLSDFVEKGWINVGTKLLISNAQLFGAEDGIEPLDSEHCPLDSNSKIGLRIRANSTRMSKWNAKLGFVNPHSFVTPGGLLLVKRLSDIIPGGGEIPIVRVFVARRYPLLYLEKSQETKTTLLTVAEEENRRREFEKRLLKAIDKLTETIETDIEKVRALFYLIYCDRSICELKLLLFL
jgi:breast cancer 2 susceptibility protein